MKFVIHRVVSHQPLFVRITVCNFPSISLAMDAQSLDYQRLLTNIGFAYA